MHHMSEWNKKYRDAKAQRKAETTNLATTHYHTVLTHKTWSSWLSYHQHKLHSRAPQRRAINHYRKSILRMFCFLPTCLMIYIQLCL